MEPAPNAVGEIHRLEDCKQSNQEGEGKVLIIYEISRIINNIFWIHIQSPRLTKAVANRMVGNEESSIQIILSVFSSKNMQGKLFTDPPDLIFDPRGSF